ncbi:hypothetical protein H1R20_g10895, partial [Candolleomyces eurysporus]
MSAHAYEVSLSAGVYPKELVKTLNRLSLHSESTTKIHTREVVFEPLDAQLLRESGQEPVFLRAKKELTEPNSPWELYSYLKPESVRTYPDATVRPYVNVQVSGDALSFAAGLGYIKKNSIYKRGYAFRRGPLIILMFQQEQPDPKTEKPIPAQPDTLWEVEVKTASPVRDAPVKQTIDLLLEVQTIMKGLLDLRRQEF